MRKTILTIVLAISLLFALSPATQAAKPIGIQDMWAYVYSWDGSMTANGRYELTRITSGITFVVLQRNSAVTMETLYVYGKKTMVTTGMAQPITGTSFGTNTVCNDMVAFAVDPSETNDTYVDLIVVDQAGGYTAIVKDFTKHTHSIIIDERPLVKHWGAAWLITTATSTEVDSGIEFDRPSIIHEMKVQVCTAFASANFLDVGLTAAGTGGDADGFINDEQIATQGWHSIYRPGVNLTVCMVSAGTGVNASDYGAFCSTREDATNVLNGPSLGTFLGNFIIGTSASLPSTNFPGILNKECLVLHGTMEQTLTYTFASGISSAVVANSTGWGIVWFNFTAIR